MLPRISLSDAGSSLSRTTTECKNNVYIAVISDTHLGARPSTDCFGHEDSEFIRFLRRLERSFDRIVLLGDIWETLTPAVPGHHATELRCARASHPEIAARLRGPKYRYLFGNHDWIAAKTDGAKDELLLDDCGTRILFTHGHQRDWGTRGARFVAELAVWCGGWLLRLGMGALYTLAERIDLEVTRRDSSGPTTPFQRWAVEAAQMRNADVVVTGHTHHAARVDHGRHLFLNSGSCSQGRLVFSTLDTRRGEYGVHSAF